MELRVSVKDDDLTHPKLLCFVFLQHEKEILRPFFLMGVCFDVLYF